MVGTDPLCMWAPLPWDRRGGLLEMAQVPPSLPTLQMCLILVCKVQPETPTKLLQPKQRLAKGKSACRVRQPESFSSPKASYETVNGMSRNLLSTLDGFELHRPVWRQ